MRYLKRFETLFDRYLFDIGDIVLLVDYNITIKNYLVDNTINFKEHLNNRGYFINQLYKIHSFSDENNDFNRDIELSHIKDNRIYATVMVSSDQIRKAEQHDIDSIKYNL